ncbi:MAG: protein kinase, partial [Myxococcota bacterium]
MKLGSYETLKVLGQGGMGVVYLARHPHHGLVALKTLRPGSGTFALHALRAEQACLARLSHPGVVDLIEQGNRDGVPWMALELLAGHALRERTRDLIMSQRIAPGPHPKASPQPPSTEWGPHRASDTAPRSSVALDSTGHEETHRPTLDDDEQTYDPSVYEAAETYDTSLNSRAFTQHTEDPSGTSVESTEMPQLASEPIQATMSEALGWLAQVCRSLGYIHGQGIVHADLKPENILITSHGSAVLVDFGLALSFGSRVEATALRRAGLRVGTVSYCSPEQLQGQALDARADLYALGCLLFELYTGHPPFAGSAQEVIHHHIHRPAPRLEAADVPRPMALLVEALLAKDPRDRPGHAQAVLHTLAQLGAQVEQVDIRTRPYLYRPDVFGRGAVLDLLWERFEQAVDGLGAMLWLNGESGVGKTRLVLELVRLVRREKQALIMVGYCARAGGGGGGVLSLFVPMLRTLADRCLRMGEEETARIFVGHDLDILLPFAPFLAELPGIEPNRAPPPQLSNTASQQRVFRSLTAVLKRFCHGRPALLVLDDVQWADELSVAALEHLIEHGPSNHLMVGTLRSEEITSLVQEVVDRCDVLQVERLGPDAVGLMVGQMLGLPSGQTPSRALVEAITARAGGNPFFVAEYLQWIVEQGLLHLDVHTGSWRVAQGQEPEQLEHLLELLPDPKSVQDAVRSRMEHLNSTELELLRAAAVLGDRFETELLHRMVMPARPHVMRYALDALVQRQLLEYDEQDTELRFVHGKLQEVTYAQIPTETLRQLHLRAAELLDARLDQGDIPLETTARHWLKADRPARARHRFVQAAYHATERWAISDAQRCFEAALELFEPDDPDAIEVRLDFAEKVLMAVHKHEAMAEQLQHVFDQLEQCDQPDLDEGNTRLWRARAHIYMGQAMFIQHRLDASQSHVDQGFALLGEHRTHDVAQRLYAIGMRMRGSIILVRSNCAEESVPKAVACYNASLETFEALGDRNEQSKIHHNMGLLYRRIKRYDASLEAYQKALDLCVHEANILSTLNAIAILYCYIEQHDKAVECFSDAIALCDEIGDLRSKATFMQNLGAAYHSNGNHEQAIAVCRESLILKRQWNDPGIRASINHVNIAHYLTICDLANWAFWNGINVPQDTMEARGGLEYVIVENHVHYLSEL